MSIIDDQVKQLLRSVLISAPGVQQSFLEHEYYKITNERLPWRNYKFSSLFEFLKALENEITRIEFSEKCADNIIYAVIDESKYNSKHAKKFASKSTSNIAGKSPEEIKAWKSIKMKLPENLMLHVASQKSLLQNPVFVNRELQGSNSFHNAILNPLKKQEKSEWTFLDNLGLDQTGYFLLSIKTKSGKSFVGRDKELLQVFEAYKPSPEITHRSGSVFIKFKVYMNAFQAWKRKHCTQFCNDLIFVRPFIFNKKKDFPYKLLLSNLPNGLKLDTLVTVLSEYGDLDAIQPDLRSGWIFVSYQTADALNKAEKNLISLPVKNTHFSITVKKLSANEMLISNADGFNKPAPSILSNTHQICAESNSGLIEKSCNSLKDESNNELKNLNDNPKCRSSESREVLCNKEVILRRKDSVGCFSNQLCGFVIDYDKIHQMCQDTSQTYPKMSKDLPDCITFIVTHPVDACRFWIILLDEDKTSQKLTEIESKLSEHVTVINKCTNLPQVGDRGCGLYKENSSWYRCWVLNTNIEEMEIKVFWCDYGNTSILVLDEFRTAFDDAWILPPLAIPCKFYGYDVDLKSCELGTGLLSDLVMGNVLMAKVNKASVYSQPHIVEIDNITCNGSSSNIINSLLQEKFIKKISDLDIENGIKESISQSESVDNLQLSKDVDHIESMFSYNKDYLEIGMISEVIDPLLFYIQCEIQNLSEIETLLLEVNLERAASFEKGDLLIYANNITRRRVLVVQSNSKKIDIFHVDYGFRQQVDASSLYKIDKKLRDKPYHARPASVALLEGFYFLDTATEFLKRLKSVPIRINFLNESSTGDVAVELFSTDTYKSFTMEMLNAGIICNDASKIDSFQSDEQKLEKLVKTGVSNGIGSKYSCKGSQSISTNDSKNNNKFVSDEIKECSDVSDQRSTSPTYPPPDILLSNKINNERSIITILSTEVILGSGQDIDVIKINSSNKLDENDVFTMLEKYEHEKKVYGEMLKSLEVLMTTSDSCVYEFYKNKKKSKLQQMTRIKKLNERLKDIELQYKKVTQETHELLCRV